MNKNQQYLDEYEKWVAGMTDEERRQARELGVLEPELPTTSTATEHDAAEDAVTEWAEPSSLGEIASTAAAKATEGMDEERVHDILRRLVGEILSQNNARLAIECLALVTGVAYTGESMTEIAKRHRITRAAVSKRCIELCQALGLDPSRAMRSLKARKSYRKSRNQHLNTTTT